MKPYMLIALFIGVLGGISPVVNKHLLVKFSHPTIFFVSAISYGILAIIFLMFNQETVHREIHKVTYNDFLIMSFESVVCAFVVDLLLYYILKDNNSHIISVLIYTSPIFTFLFAYLFLNETINMEKIAGLLIIFAGISLIMRDSI